MKRLLATALAATLALGSLAAPALAGGHGHGNGHDRGNGNRSSSHARSQHQHSTSASGTQYGYGTAPYGYGNAPNNYGNTGNQGPHGCINPAGHVRGWCKQNTTNGVYNNGANNNGNYNGYPNGNGGQANQQVSGIVTAVSGNRITILMGLRSLNIDTSQAYRNGGATNVGIGSTVTAYGYYGNNNTFYATQIN